MPFSMLAGTLVKLIMWNFTQLVSHFRQTSLYRFSQPIPTTLGTTVGDPIEANAAGGIFYRGDDLVVGSVKGNLG